MPELSDPYSILHLPPGASRRDIRRRYRELLRDHHPDVSADPLAAHEFAATLGRAYRAALRQAAPDADTDGHADGLDPELRAAVAEADPARRPFQNTLGQARELALLGRYAEAQVVCAQAIAVDPDCAEAHRLLGAVYEGLGLRAEAAEERAEAELLERIGPAPFRHAVTSGGSDRAGLGVSGPTAALPVQRPWGLLVAGIVAGGCACAALVCGGTPQPLLGVHPGRLAFSAAAVGILVLGLCLGGRLRPIGQELGGGSGARWSRVWPGALVPLLAPLCAPLAALAHLAAVLLVIEPLGTWAALWLVVAAGVLVAGLAGQTTPLFWWVGLNALASGAILAWAAASVWAGARRAR